MKVICLILNNVIDNYISVLLSECFGRNYKTIGFKKYGFNPFPNKPWFLRV